MFKPQHLLVEERGLGNQIKRIKDLIPSKEEAVECNTLGSAKYLEEQLTAIVESLEDIKTGIKHENDRILKNEMKLGIPQRSEEMIK
jgi:hypothetical protein